MKSHLSISTPSPPFFFLFILLLLLIHFPSFSSTFNTTDWYTICNNTFNCGEITGVDYPFWGGDRPKQCGHPDLHLNCNNTLVTITIFKLDYRVLQIDQPNQILTIKRNDLAVGDICPAELINTTIESSLFEYASTYVNLTIQFGCPSLNNPIPIQLPQQLTCTINGKDYQNNYIVPGALGPGPCRASIVIPVQSVSFTGIGEFSDIGKLIEGGFEVRWKVNSTECGKCKYAGGRCGFDLKSNQFACVCPESDQPPEGYGGSCSGSTLVANTVPIPPSYQLSPVSDMDPNARRAQKKKLEAEAAQARQLALKAAKGKLPRTVDAAIVDETFDPNPAASSAIVASSGRTVVSKEADPSVSESLGHKRPQTEKAPSDRPPKRQTRSSVQLEEINPEVEGDVHTETLMVKSLPRGYSGKEAIWLDSTFTKEIDLPKARQIGEAIADVIPLGPIPFGYPDTVQSEIGRGILARFAAQDDTPAKDEIAEIRDLSGQFGIVASLIGTRMNKVLEVAERHQVEMKGLTTQLGASDKAKSNAEKRAKQFAGDLKKVKKKLEEQSEELKGSQEELARANDEISKLKDALAEADKVAEEKAKEAAEAARSKAVADYKASDDFLNTIESSFDQGFSHLARCIWAEQGKGYITLEQMVRWVSTSQGHPDLLSFHADIPYVPDLIASIQAEQKKQGEAVWDPPATNPANFEALKDLPPISEPGDEFVNTPNDS